MRFLVLSTLLALILGPTCFGSMECNELLRGIAEPPVWKQPKNRGARDFGGFAFGMNADEIQKIAESFAPPNGLIHPISGKKYDTILFNASNRQGFWNKTGSIIRDITGAHFFNDGNHRIAFEVVKRLMSRNGIITKKSDSELYDVISKVGRGAAGFTTAEEIAAALRGY